jgi:DNA repair ATPase RecN
MTNNLNEAIALLQSATQSLTELATIPAEQQPLRETISNTVEQIHRALAELSAAINPPSLEKIPPELLTKADRLGIPLDY